MQQGPERHDGAEVRSRTAWRVLVAVLIVEAVGGVALMWPVVQAVFAPTHDTLGARVSVLLAVVLAWAWVCVTLAGAVVKRAPWARGSAITIHVLMFAAGTGVLQGILGTPLLGWALVLLAFLGFFSALLARPIVSDAAGSLGATEHR